MINSEIRKVINVFVSLLSIKGIDLLIPLITLPYLIHTIGIEKYGLINFSISISVYFFAIVQYGFPITSVRDISRCEGEGQLNKIVSVTVLSMLILALLSTIIFLVLISSIEVLKNHVILHVITFFSLMVKALIPTWYFQGIQKMKEITWISIMSRISMLIFILLIVKNENDYIYIPVINLICSLFVLLFTYYYVFGKFGVRFVKLSMTDISRSLRRNSSAFISQFSPNLYTNTATFLLGMTATPMVVGIFTSASKIIDILGLFSYTISSATLPYISKDITTHKNVARIMIACGLGLMGFVIFSSGFITNYLFPSESSDVEEILLLMSPILPLLFFNLAYGNNYLMLVGKEKIMRNIILSSSIMSVFYTIPAIVYFGIYGSIFTLIFTRVIIGTSYYFYYKKITAANL